MEGKAIQLRLSIVRTRPNLKQVRIRHAHTVEHGGARAGEHLAEAFPVVIEATPGADAATKNGRLLPCSCSTALENR